MKKKVAILGSTGSIGIQGLQVIDEHKDHFTIEVLSANNNFNLLIEQAIKYKPNIVIIGNSDHYSKVRDSLDSFGINVYGGIKAITQVMEMDAFDIVLLGIQGIHGLSPLLKALEYNKQIALANKESLVVAGDLISKAANESRGSIIPVDSEHSAIFQCLMGEINNPIEKIVLTASGGPFINKDIDYMRTASVDEALSHPNWNMGKKVSIDSATLMNKGLEAIEAHWLFDVPVDKIEVLIHPESIVHSLVYFGDGSVKTQLSYPDMRIPIQFALTYPNRINSSYPTLDLLKNPKLSFKRPDVKKFRNLALAFDALSSGGNVPCILNAANEVAVQSFLENKIHLLQIYDIVEECMNSIPTINKPSLTEYFETDTHTRQKAIELISK